jgi:hypothetical protein
MFRCAECQKEFHCPDCGEGRTYESELDKEDFDLFCLKCCNGFDPDKYRSESVDEEE